MSKKLLALATMVALTGLVSTAKAERVPPILDSDGKMLNFQTIDYDASYVAAVYTATNGARELTADELDLITAGFDWLSAQRGQRDR